MMRGVAFCSLFLICVATASAQGGSVQRTCPIDGSRFQYQPPPALTSRETYLDQRSVDPNAPWPHAKCPGNGFVLYKSNFPENEIAKLREFVLSDRYRSMSDIHSTRYLEAALRKHLGESPYVVAWSLVQATWEVSSDPVRYRGYAEEALATYDGIKLEALPDIRHRILKRMLSAEFARRLGLFDSAKERLLEMRDDGEFSTKFLQRIIDFQLKLVRAKDTGSHRIPY